jgi:ABC-2 type transport system ATP-binding protein
MKRAGVAAVRPATGPGAWRVELGEGGAVADVLSQLVAAGVTSISTSRPSLEEVYVHMIGDRGLKV